MLDTEQSRNDSNGENTVIDDWLWPTNTFTKISLVSKNGEKELKSNPSYSSNQVEHDAKLRNDESKKENEEGGGKTGHIFVFVRNRVFHIQFVQCIHYGIELHRVAEYHIDCIQCWQQQEITTLLFQPQQDNRFEPIPPC